MATAVAVTDSENAYVKVLEGRTLRVAMPGDSGSGYTLVTDAETGERKGSVVEFMQKVAERGKFDVEILNISESSKSKYSSVSHLAPAPASFHAL